MPAPRATPGNGAPHRNDTDPGEQLLEVAAEHATRRVPTARPEQSAGEVRDGIVGSSFESAVDVAVLDGESLVGIVSIETLLAADRDARIESVMDADPPVVEPGVDQEVAAWVMCRRGEASLGGRFRRPVRWADPAGSNAQGPAHRARRGSGSHGRLHGGHRARGVRPTSR